MSWDSYISRGITAVGKGDKAGAEKSFKDALQFAKSNFQRSDSRLALTLSLLGHVYFQIEDFDTAEKLLDQSVKLHSASRVLNEPCVLMDVFSLGEIKRMRGKATEAYRLYAETIEQLKQSNATESDAIKHATEHFDSMIRSLQSAKDDSDRLLSQLAGTANGGNEPESAIASGAVASAQRMKEVWQQQLNKGVSVLSTNHDTEIDERENLVAAYLNLESALRIARNVFSAGSLEVITTMRALADVAARLQMFEVAEELYRDAIHMSGHAEIRGNISVAALRINLALIYVEADKLVEAKNILDEEAIPDEMTSTSHMVLNKRVETAYTTIRVWEQSEDLLSQAEDAEGVADMEKASRLVNTAITKVRQAFKPHHPHQARLLRYRSALLRKMGNEEQSQELADRAERITRSHETRLADFARATEDLPRPEREVAPV